MDEENETVEGGDAIEEVDVITAATVALEAANARIAVLEDENRALALSNATLKSRNLELLNAIPAPDASDDDADDTEYEDGDDDPIDGLFDTEDED